MVRKIAQRSEIARDRNRAIPVCHRQGLVAGRDPEMPVGRLDGIDLCHLRVMHLTTAGAKPRAQKQELENDRDTKVVGIEEAEFLSVQQAVTQTKLVRNQCILH